MVKRLCKLNRHDIRASLGEVHRLVAHTNFVCGSCARSSADKGALCKPQALLKSAHANSAVVVVPDAASAALSSVPSTASKKSLKKQKKLQKKLAKVLKKHSKLLKKQQSIQREFAKINPQLTEQQTQLLNGAQFH